MPDTKIVSTIYTQLSTIFSGISSIKEVFTYPTMNVTKYPAVIFFPDEWENDFDSNEENYKIYRFVAFVVVGKKPKETMYNPILSNLVDDINEAFDSGWSLSAIGGHRSWVKIDNGAWTLEGEDKNLEAVARLNISIKLLTSN